MKTIKRNLTKAAVVCAQAAVLGGVGWVLLAAVNLLMGWLQL